MAKKRKKRASGQGLNRIGDVLNEKGVSQYRLEKDTGLAHSLVNAYTQNARQPGLENLEKIATALDVDGGELLNF